MITAMLNRQISEKILQGSILKGFQQNCDKESFFPTGTFRWKSTTKTAKKRHHFHLCEFFVDVESLQY